MSSRFDLIAQQLLQKSFSDCTVSELQQLTQDHPYLAPAQFLLAKKLQQEGAPEAKTQLQKAALYYHQPAAFDAFLNSEFPDLDLIYEEDEEETDLDEAPLNFTVDLPKAVQPVVEQVPQIEKTERPEIPAAATHSADAETSPAPVAEPVPAVAPVQQAAEVPAFEPYHTVDYFASQGIRLSREEATKDKMGKQLRSFTEWLKAMKRLPATEQLKDLDPHTEQKVENMAAHSVVDTEIVTETMAEVWLKQGNWEKAAEVYHKLSLSNPSKRAYFAAKLERLRNTLKTNEL